MNFQRIHDKVRRRQTPLLRLALGLTVMACFIGFTGVAAERSTRTKGSAAAAG